MQNVTFAISLLSESAYINIITTLKQHNRMIRIEKLVKTFRTEEVETVALNGVDMEVKEGEFVAIMSPAHSNLRFL